MTRTGLLSLAALVVAALILDVLVEDRTMVFNQPVRQAAASEAPPPTDVVSTDLEEWDVAGRGALDVRDGVWTASGKGRVTWPRPVTDMVLDVGFRFPRGPVDAGIVVRMPGSNSRSGVEVALDLSDDGLARVGEIEGLVTPIVYADPLPGEWHEIRVSAIGERVTVFYDGRSIVDWLDQEGRMAAQGKVTLRFSDGLRFREVELAADPEGL